MCLVYGIPLLSGKDSMYVDGHLPGRYGETHKVSALESLQFSATSVIADIEHCVTADAKLAGDLVYLLGVTRDELGASEYYDMLGHVGCQVPQVQPQPFMQAYRQLAGAIADDLLASAHGIYRGGLAVHLALVAMAGDLGITMNCRAVPVAAPLRTETLLFSETAGRFLLTIDPKNQEVFESRLSGLPLAQIGTITAEPRLLINGLDEDPIVDLSLAELKNAWQKTFGDLL